MSSTKWILRLMWAILLPTTFSKECAYRVRELLTSPMFSSNDTILPVTGYAMIIETPSLDQGCVLSLRNLPLSLFQDGVAVYYFICMSIFPVRLDTEGIPRASSPILYLQVGKCLLGFDGIRKLEMIYDLKVLTYFNLMPTEESLQVQNENETQIHENVVAYSIKLSNFTGEQPWIFMANRTFPSLVELSIAGVGLQDLPPDLALRFPNIQSIELVNNRLTRVPELEFGNSLFPLPLGLRRTPAMQDHYVDSVGIDVDPSFFRKILILDQNLISSLEDFSFNGTLHKISVAKNRLAQISPRTFANVRGLNSVDLSHNLLSSFPELTLRNCTDLLHLKLSNNNFSEIPADAFKDNQNLLKLDLSQNNLADLQPGTFANLKSLKYLDVSHNNIDEFRMEVLPKEFGNLDEIKLSNNNLREFPVEFFMNYRPMLIDLQDCQITIESFTDILDSMNDMQIPDIRSSDIPEIQLNPEKTEINLSNNLINRLDFGNFSESQTRKMLMLLNNFKLDLSRNPIECDCHLLPLLEFFQKAKEDKIHSGKEYFYQNWKCKYPTEFENLPILSLAREDLYCQEPMPDCPKECSCYQRPVNKTIIVDCRHQQLASLPNKMPPGRLELWLQYNNINKLEQRDYLQRIEYLNMDHNRISDLGIVKILKNLKRASFFSNILVSLPTTIRDLPLRSLNISRNRFICDCDNLWLKSWLLSVQGKVRGWFDIRCLTYSGNVGSIINIPDTDFKCLQEEGLLTEYLEIVGIFIFILAVLACILIFVKLRKPVICSFK